MIRLALLVAVAAFPLAGCGGAKEQAAPEPSAAAQTVPAGPDAKPGLSLTDGKLLLPVVAGRPGAVYFTLRNNGDKAVTLAGVHVEGAGKMEMHETKGGTMSPVKDLPLEPGKTLEFARGGLHVMAFDLADTLKAGGVAEITLSFADGDKLSAPLAIEAMAAAKTGGMKTGGMEMSH
ncbi:MAG TPA: copper chaperone PCu(A)C [Novosphingobium sp.]|nr:copper chaperone PCu(A)C [Novosphingobium sp.]